MKQYQTTQELRAEISSWKKKGLRVGFVPTMGYLHDGHLSLVKRMKKEVDRIIVSIFVNPLQFNDPKDLDVYPVDLPRDAALLEKEGVDALFIPSRETMYPLGHQTKVTVTTLSQELEGAFRPGHFEGVTTVVSLLFNIVQPDAAIFGEKDFQQLRIIEQMVKDLAMPIDIIRGELIRETDGLAMSSRNVRLKGEARGAALVLSRSLTGMQSMYADGETSVALLCSRAAQVIAEEQLAKLEYVSVVDEATLKEVNAISEDRPYRAIMAVFVDGVRLIDTMRLTQLR